jgi:S-(hydroxymethyl)glutathione dehydrogenase/alcohol dehydrogenase
VLEISQGVTKARAGDAVILSWIKGSGMNVPGTVYDWNGQAVNAGGVTTFSKHAIVSENRLTKISPDFPLEQAAMLGCAVPTGLGSVFNTARPMPGQSLAVFGAGGIGQCAIAGAVIAGCTPIIAVDVVPSKLDLAQKMGATHVIDARDSDPVVQIKEITSGGADFAIEASGRPSVMAQALQSVRQQGGAAVIVGNAHHGEHIELDPGLLNAGKQLRGTWGGDTDPDRDYPRYAKLIEAGRLELALLMSGGYTLEDVNRALDDLEAGRAARPIIDMRG